MQTIHLHRRKYDDKQVLGQLNDESGKFSCYTLERPWKQNQSGISCIPTGIYTCAWTFSLRFMRYTYEVLNVPLRSGIRIHKGNYFFNVEGCILLGNSLSDINNDGEVDVTNSTDTIAKFEALMNKQTFTLAIS